MNATHIPLPLLIKQHVWGPVGSVLFHMAAVVLLLLYAVAPPEEPPPDVSDIVIVETKAPVLDKIIETLVDRVEPKVTQDPPEMPPDVPVVNNGAAEVEDVSGVGAGPASEVAGIGSDVATPATGFEIAAQHRSPLILKNIYEARTAAGQGAAVRKYGGDQITQDAVLRALRWFKANQSENGSWDKMDGHPVAFSGLALLAFLAHGEKPGSVEFGQTVERALKYLVSRQNAKGMIGAAGYEHAIGVYAISEGFGLTKIMALKDAMDKGIEIIIEGQQANGGFDYNYAQTARWDLSVAGWQFQALKAAMLAGCSHPKLEQALKKGTEFLTTVAYDPRGGGFGYASPSSTISMTSAGTLCLQLMGKPTVPQVRTGLKYLEELPCIWAGGKDAGKQVAGAAADPKAVKQPLYTWYYATQAKFQSGEKDWESWKPRFIRALVKNQIIDGATGYWQGGDHGGIVYSTALCCLMLEVFYRYLPTYQHVAPDKGLPAAAKTDDLVIEVG